MFLPPARAFRPAAKRLGSPSRPCGRKPRQIEKSPRVGRRVGPLANGPCEGAGRNIPLPHHQQPPCERAIARRDRGLPLLRTRVVFARSAGPPDGPSKVKRGAGYRIGSSPGAVRSPVRRGPLPPDANHFPVFVYANRSFFSFRSTRKKGETRRLDKHRSLRNTRFTPIIFSGRVFSPYFLPETRNEKSIKANARAPVPAARKNSTQFIRRRARGSQ